MATAFRGSIYHCLADPGEEAREAAVQFIGDGVLVVESGHIVRLGPADEVLSRLGSGVEIVDHTGKLILPGLIDCHVHYPQINIVASNGGSLADWLERYAYPAEAKFADASYARTVASVFVNELLRNGTTTALVFATVHPQSVDAIFEAAESRNMRLVAGKVLMDRNCPVELRDDPESAYSQSRALIQKWHGRARLGYAITPRFALTSSEAQLAASGRLAAEFPDTWIHTHVAEQTAEVDSVAARFPASRSYLDVYDGFGLVRKRSVFAHCLHVDGTDRSVMARARAAAAFCPTSNLFLGSGLFDLRAMTDAGVPVGLATDVGAGTSLSMFRTMSEAYKVLRLQGQALPASRALYLASLGAATALGMDHCIGNLDVGKEADFIVVDPQASTVMSGRASSAGSIDELLLPMLFLGDDRNIVARYLQGSRVTV